MHRTLRMLGILMNLQRGSTTIGQLAAAYECSRKTIQRDIAALLELNIPVLRSPGAAGGVSLDPRWTMAPMNLAPDEVETVILALENATHLPAAEQALAKIRSAAKPAYFDSVAESPLRPQSLWSSPASMPSGVAQLRNVMNREMWCRVDYSGGSNPGWRMILPKELRILEGRWYVHGIDERSRERRIFRVDRIRDIVPTLAPPDAAEIIATALNQPDHQSDIYSEIVVDLTAPGRQFCRDHSHFHQSIVGNQLRFRCPPGEYHYVARELLRMGTDCRVLTPPELIAKVRELVANIGRHIDDNADIKVS